jgi:hypothetical protein
MGTPPVPPPAPLKQQVCPVGQETPPAVPQAPPASNGVVTAPEEPDDDVPDDAPDAPDEPLEPPPLLAPFPPSSLLLLFVVEPPHAAARARPTETENQAVRLFMDEAPSPTLGAQATPDGSRLGSLTRVPHRTTVLSP